MDRNRGGRLLSDQLRHRASTALPSVMSDETPRFAYPRPQLQRPQWIDLNGRWRFLFDDARRYAHPSEIAEWPLFIEVPFPPESQASGIGDTGFHFTCWYEREFEIAAEGRRVLLHFGAVDYYAR